jgi:hypothetical protein
LLTFFSAGVRDLVACAERAQQRCSNRPDKKHPDTKNVFGKAVSNQSLAVQKKFAQPRPNDRSVALRPFGQALLSETLDPIGLLPKCKWEM